MKLSNALRPAGIAIVGASPRRFASRVIIDNCKTLGFAGECVPVNPQYETISGVPAVGKLAEMDRVPDVAVALVGPRLLLEVIEEAVELGVRGVIIPGLGFTDTGKQAKDLGREIKSLTDAETTTIIGPNCMGSVDLISGAAPYIGTVPPHVRRGSVGLVSQSGAVVEAFINAAGRVPLSTAVSCGDELTTGLAAYLDFFLRDDATRSVVAFVEGLKDGPAVIRAACRLTEVGKPLAVCLVGRSRLATEAIVAHSGRLARAADVTAAALRQSGAMVCYDLEELFSISELLGAEKWPFGPRMHAVVNSGGEGSLLADHAQDAGLRVPAVSERGVRALRQQWPSFHVGNPLDPWGVDEYQRVFPTALQVMGAEPGDVLLVSVDQQRTCGDYERQLGMDLAGYLADAANHHQKVPVFVSPTSQDPDEALSAYCRERGVALLRGLRPALAAIRQLANWKPSGEDITANAFHSSMLTRVQTSYTDEATALDALESYGVPTVRRARVASADEAARAATKLGFPVALKAVSDKLHHKTELGLVHLDLCNVEQVRQAALLVKRKAETIGTNVDFLVAEQVRGDLEVIVGYRRDEQFGPTVLTGLGGIWVEEFDDVAHRFGRIEPAQAEDMLGLGMLGKILQSKRGARLSIKHLARVIAAVSALGCDRPSILQIDVNPVIVHQDGVVAADALIGAISHS